MLDGGISKQGGNTGNILAYYFNSTSRQWFPFLHNFKDIIPPSNHSLSDHISWILVHHAIKMSGNHLVMHLEAPLILTRKEFKEDGILDVLQSTTSLT